MTEIQKISNDLTQLEDEIAAAEKELAAAQAKHDLLQKQGLNFGVKNAGEANAKIAENEKSLAKSEKEIQSGYTKLKSEFVWGE